ncbi:MAG: hypothetical protein RBT80_26225 [Candidatus Vecturithrix sp.]|jgi:hypothetical protein|nr:hypothetical protein [Candidatus Vecturithrix sp.]
MSAYYKVDNRILSESEYEAERNWIWGFWLFIIGALACGNFIFDHIPQEWSKEMRFGILVLGSIMSGLILAYVATYIRMMFYVLLGVGVLVMVGGWLWNLV